MHPLSDENAHIKNYEDYAQFKAIKNVSIYVQLGKEKNNNHNLAGDSGFERRYREKVPELSFVVVEISS